MDGGGKQDIGTVLLSSGTVDAGSEFIWDYCPDIRSVRSWVVISGDALYEYKKVDTTGARYAAEEMIDVLLSREAYEDFPQRQIELIETAAGIRRAE